MQLRLDPDAVVARRFARWSRTLAAEVQRRVEHAAPLADRGDGDSLADPVSRAHLIEEVLQEVAFVSPLKGADLDVELANSIVHFDVVAGDFAARSDRQLHAIATACVGELLGDTAADRELRWQLQHDARHLLICAIDRSELSVLVELARSFGLRLASVTPQLAVQWNRFGRATRPGRGIFALSMSCDLAIASVVDGVISSISVGPGIRIDSAGVAPSTPAADRAPPAEGIDALDVRVDRLILGGGQDPADQSGFVLVAPDSVDVVASRRWAVMGLREAQA